MIMDYKEKYEMALEGIQEILGSGEDSIKMSRLQLRLQGIFPELKENEDEKIRKGLIFHYQGDGCICTNEYRIDFKNIRAWLEKQGEQEPTDKVEPRFKVGDIISNGTSEVKIIEVNDNSYSVTNDEIENDCNLSNWVVYFKDQEDWELVEQNPAWSKEDSPYYDDICEILINLLRSETANANKTAVQKDLDWLKSFKDRVQPQLKQEWSDTDKNILFLTIDNLKFLKDTISTDPKYYVNIINIEREISWLKSLRPQNKYVYNPYKAVVESIAEMCKHYDKASHSGLRDFYDNVKVKCKDAKEYDSLYPQNTWKPSDEQMEALDDAIAYCSERDYETECRLDNGF